jgi:hypothetical protein
MRVTSILILGALLAACGRSGEAPASQRAGAEPALMAGMGNHHHPIATTSAEAQKYFDQGVALVFAFNHEEAVRSLRRAAVLDPAAAMPHWRIAWALGPNYNLCQIKERGASVLVDQQEDSVASDNPVAVRS